jgi:two-component system alkaline phosphatase synthesis response regulator PhoP
VANSNTEKIKIIYAEDQESLARLVVFKLAKEGFDVRILNSGENVVEKVIEQKPELILLDLMLPIKDGMTVLEELKDNDEVKNIPVIMISVHGGDEKVRQAFNFGAVDYIQKPLSIDELTTRIRKALA